jgi:hypothetical protein
LTIERVFLDLMPQTVTWYPKSSTDAYGKDTFSGTGKSQRCRIEKSTGISQKADGQDVSVDGTIYFYGVSTIGIEDKLVLPDGSSRIVLNIETSDDGDGAFATKLTFGKMSG